MLLITTIQKNKCIINLKHGDYIHKTNAKPTFINWMSPTVLVNFTKAKLQMAVQ